MTIRRNDIRYSDFSNDMLVHPVTGDIVLVTNEDSVKQRLKNIMFTGHYERPHNPSFGAGLQKYLFENISQFTADSIQEVIRANINAFEPTIDLHDVKVDVMPDENAYEVTIVFSVVNNPEPITLTQILRRSR